MDLTKKYRTKDDRIVCGLHHDPHITGTLHGIVYESEEEANIFSWDIYGKPTLGSGYENYTLIEV